MTTGWDKCKTCEGLGYIYIDDYTGGHGRVPCSDCDGSGYQSDEPPPSRYFPNGLPRCQRCGGTGGTDDWECPDCEGSGVGRED